MSKAFYSWREARKSGMSSSKTHTDEKEKHSMTPIYRKHASMLAQMDKSEIACFVCKSPLKRVKPIDAENELAGIEPEEVIYECKNNHVFSGDVLIYLYFNDGFWT